MTIAEAILALRQALEKTQQDLATLLDISMSAVYKYENGRTPEPGVLLKLIQLAEDRKQDDLAIVFREQMYKDMRKPDTWEGVARLEFRDELEKIHVAALLLLLRNRNVDPQWSRDAFRVFQNLEPYREKVNEKIKKHQARLSLERTILKYCKEAEKAGACRWDEENKKYVFNPGAGPTVLMMTGDQVPALESEKPGKGDQIPAPEAEEPCPV